MWVRDGYGDRAFIVDVPERCQAAHSWQHSRPACYCNRHRDPCHPQPLKLEYLGRKMHSSVSRGSWTQRHTEAECQTLSKNYTPTTLSAQLGSVQIIITSSQLLQGAVISPGCLHGLWGGDGAQARIGRRYCLKVSGVFSSFLDQCLKSCRVSSSVDIFHTGRNTLSEISSVLLMVDNLCSGKSFVALRSSALN